MSLSPAKAVPECGTITIVVKVTKHERLRFIFTLFFSDVYHEMDACMVGVHSVKYFSPLGTAGHVPRYTVHSGLLYFKSTLLFFF